MLGWAVRGWTKCKSCSLALFLRIHLLCKCLQNPSAVQMLWKAQWSPKTLSCSPGERGNVLASNKDQVLPEVVLEGLAGIQVSPICTVGLQREQWELWCTEAFPCDSCSFSRTKTSPVQSCCCLTPSAFGSPSSPSPTYRAFCTCWSLRSRRLWQQANSLSPRGRVRTLHPISHTFRHLSVSQFTAQCFKRFQTVLSRADPCEKSEVLFQWHGHKIPWARLAFGPSFPISQQAHLFFKNVDYWFGNTWQQRALFKM